MQEENTVSLQAIQAAKTNPNARVGAQAAARHRTPSWKLAGTGMAYRAISLARRATRCPAAILLRTRYAMSGTDVAHGSIVLKGNAGDVRTLGLGKLRYPPMHAL
eukprot:1693909-Rhodomonas_salina.1